VRLGIFAGIFCGIVMYGFAVSRTRDTAGPGGGVRNPAQATYSGAVVDVATLAEIGGAKVTLLLAGASPSYTDSNGHYSIQAAPSSEPIRVRVEATNYKIYEQLLPPGPDNHFEDIRLEPLPKPAVTPPNNGGGHRPPKPSAPALSGTVVDAGTDEEIRGASVTLTINDEEPRHRTTDSTGDYKFSKVPLDASGSVRVTALGYLPFERQLSASTRPELRQIRLKPKTP